MSTVDPCTHLRPCAADVLAKRKLGILNFSAAAGIDSTEMLLIYMAASCDPNEQVGIFSYL